MSWASPPKPKLPSCGKHRFVYLFPLEVRAYPALYLAFGHCGKRTDGLKPEKCGVQQGNMDTTMASAGWSLIKGNVSNSNTWDPDAITAFIIVPIRALDRAQDQRRAMAACSSASPHTKPNLPFSRSLKTLVRLLHTCVRSCSQFCAPNHPPTYTYRHQTDLGRMQARS